MQTLNSLKADVFNVMNYSTPVKYIVDWNDANNCFTGSLATL